MKNDGVLRDLVKGGIAGAVATWVMGGVTTYMYKRESPEAREREEAANNGETSLKQAATRLAKFLGIQLDDDGKRRMAQAIHWGLGIGSGAAYSVLRRRVRWAGEAQGLGFGTAFWLAIDEGLVPLLGLSKGPGAYPWQSHARGLAGHLSFGLVTETTLDLLDQVA